MADYSLTEMAVKMHCPGNVVQLDDAGLPSILVYIPKFKLSDVLAGGDDTVHPAFIVNGKEIPGFYYSKYENVVYDGKAYSLPAEKPQNVTDFDAALGYCEEKGHGWHLSTAAEWAAIALWCKANDFQPYGNNVYGKDTRETEQKAIPSTYDSNGNIQLVATGTGPLTWSHDGTASGIWDLNGNAYEWQGGFRTVWGEVQILANNNAADPNNPQNETSTCWKAINAADGTLVDPECSPRDTGVKTSGNTVKLDFINNTWTYSTGVSTLADDVLSCYFYKVACTDDIADATKMLLRALALLPEEGKNSLDYGDDIVYFRNNAAERYMYRGGSSQSHAGGGVFAIFGHYQKTTRTEYTGFRAAYIPDIE